MPTLRTITIAFAILGMLSVAELTLRPNYLTLGPASASAERVAADSACPASIDVPTPDKGERLFFELPPSCGRYHFAFIVDDLAGKVSFKLRNPDGRIISTGWINGLLVAGTGFDTAEADSDIGIAPSQASYVVDWDTGSPVFDAHVHLTR